MLLQAGSGLVRQLGGFLGSQADPLPQLSGASGQQQYSHFQENPVR